MRPDILEQARAAQQVARLLIRRAIEACEASARIRGGHGKALAVTNHAALRSRSGRPPEEPVDRSRGGGGEDA